MELTLSVYRRSPFDSRRLPDGERVASLSTIFTRTIRLRVPTLAFVAKVGGDDSCAN